jgi:hypothetical protein
MTIQFRRGTAENISAANPVPAAGQPVFETNTGFLKIGDGYSSYNALHYVHEGARVLLDGYLNDSPGETNLYVSVSGSDSYPGTQAFPYRQPQTAINHIVLNNFPAGSTINIYCGAGTFEAPDTSLVPANITVRIYADLSDPLIDGYSTAPTPSLEDGYAGLWVIITNGYSGSISTATHWVYNSDFQTGAVTYNSESPEVRIVSDGYVLWPVHITQPQFDLLEYATTFECSDNLTKFIGNTKSLFTQRSNYLPYSNVEYFGIHFDLIGLNRFEFHGLKLTGCKFTQNVTPDAISRTPTGGLVLKNCYANIITVLQNSSKLTAIDGTAFSGIFHNEVEMNDSHLHSGIFNKGLKVLGGDNILGFNGLHGFDLREFGIDYYTSNIYQESSSTAQSLSTYLSYASLSRSNGMTFSINPSRTITGDVSIGFSILNAVLSNIETTCAGNLTCSTADVQFGGGASTSTFAALPATDAGDTVPYFARVS